MVQRPFNFAIVDEVDFDPDRRGADAADHFRPDRRQVRPLHLGRPAGEDVRAPSDYEQDEKQKSVVLTEDGTEKAERMLEEAGLIEGRNLYDIANTQVVHHLNQALKANVMFKKDIDYIVKDGKVVIIDEFTGRMMDGRRWSDGLHQAVEAKEGVQIEPENQTLASITFQNYFRMYPKLSGMTGTAMTEAPEFFDIYKMNVVSIPTNVPVLRMDEDDVFYKSMPEKFAAITQEIKAKQEHRPAGTGRHHLDREIGDAVRISRQGRDQAFGAERPLPRAGGAYRRPGGRHGRGDDRHQHGRPRHRHPARRQRRFPHRGRARRNGGRTPETRHRRSNASAPKSPNEKQRVLDAGGLYVLGTERHESRRIDNQLRGRSGRQGDPGLSRFYLSLDDDLLRIFGPQTMFSRLMNKNLEDGEAIVRPWISKAIETAQKKVEARNYDIRKQVVEFDDVMNDQRKVIYEQRADIMDAETVSDVITDMRAETAAAIVAVNCPQGTYPEQWNVAGLKESIDAVFGLQPPIDEWLEEEAVEPEMIMERLQELADDAMAAKLSEVEPERWNESRSRS